MSDEAYFLFAALLQGFQFRGESGLLRRDGGEALGVVGTDRGFALEDTLLDVEVVQLARGVLDLGWRGVLSKGETGTCGV